MPSKQPGPLQALAQRRPVGVAFLQARNSGLEIGRAALVLSQVAQLAEQRDRFIVRGGFFSSMSATTSRQASASRGAKACNSAMRLASAASAARCWASWRSRSAVARNWPHVRRG
jgi:hypothetical protein